MLKTKVSKRIASLFVAVTSAVTLFAQPLGAKADIMDLGNDLQTEIEQIAQLKQNALSQYENQDYTDLNAPADFRVLFVECTSVTYNNTTYTISDGSDEDQIFDEAVVNFEHSVEEFSNHNVNIITDKKYINETISATTDYILYEDVEAYLKDLAPSGYYDSVIVCSGVPCPPFTLGVTSLGLFNGNTEGYGYSYSTLYSSDDEKINSDSDINYPYLTTTNIMIHEWIHTLEAFREFDIVFPSADGYSNTQLSWPEYTTTGLEPNLTNFYKAVLRAEVIDTTNNNHRIGMFPAFWNLTPRKMNLGTFLIQENSSNKYLQNNSGVLEKNTSLINDETYQWRLLYDLFSANPGVSIISLSDKTKRFDILNLSISDNCIGLGGASGYREAQSFNIVYNSDGTYKIQCKMSGYSNYYLRLNGSSLGFSSVDDCNTWNVTKVSHDDGVYYIKNVGTNQCLALGNDGTVTSSSYSANTAQRWKITYNDDNFYTISPLNDTSKYLDLNNVTNADGTNVNLSGWTGYTAAQTWQLRMTAEGYYNIVPLASTTRCLVWNDGLHITTLNGDSSQNWIIEKVNNGAELFEGSYQIKNSDNQYLSFSDGDIVLSSTPETWNITKVDDRYYTISPENSTAVLYWDVANAYDLENNRVGLYYATGYITAQYWRFVVQNDGTVQIMPMLSMTRGLKYDDTLGSVISVSANNWDLVKV